MPLSYGRYLKQYVHLHFIYNFSLEKLKNSIPNSVEFYFLYIGFFQQQYIHYCCWKHHKERLRRNFYIFLSLTEKKIGRLALSVLSQGFQRKKNTFGNFLYKFPKQIFGFNNFILEGTKTIFGNVFIPSKCHWAIGLLSA